MSEQTQEQVPTETPSSEETAPSNSAFSDLLGSIKDGERQKYGTVEDALKAINPAQEHIKSLEEENAELKGKLQESKTVQDLMTKLETQAPSQENQPQEKQDFDQDKLTQIVNSVIEGRETESRAKSNIDTVVKAFSDKYGERAEEVYNQVAKDAGIGSETLKDLATISPQAVLKLAGLDKTSNQRQPSTTQSQHSAESFSSSNGEVSAKVPMVGYSSDDLTSAWKATEAIVNKS